MDQTPTTARVLLDSSVPRQVGHAFTDAGHDIVHVRDCPDGDPGDPAVLNAAAADARIVITLDKDFGELAVFEGVPHRGIIRLVTMSIGAQIEGCLAALAAYRGELEAVAIVTVETSRLRLRPPDAP